MTEQRISHYRLLGKLGEGGMGEVFVAEDETLRRRVALKSIRAEYRLDRELQARFLREARVLSQLDHPNICRVFNFVSEPDADYIVLELIEGEDLAHLIRAGIESRRAMELAQQITDALAAAHAAGVVHRDLKPANVMVTREGVAKVLDFGLSRVRAPEDVGGQDSAAAGPLPAPPPNDPRIGEEGTLIWSFPAPAEIPSPSSLFVGESLRTTPGGLMGTLRYMSPEQARGESVSAASDMYALGLVLQELFTGRPAHEASLTPQQVLERTRQGQSLPLRGTDRDLADLIESLKSPSPTRRPTAIETLRRLHWIQHKPQRRLRRALAAAVLLVAAVGATKYTLDLRHERGRALGRTEAALGMMETLFSEQIPVLAQVGRLDAFDAAAEALRAYFDGIAEEQLTDRERVKLAQLLMLVGTVRESQGRSEEALSRFGEALALTEELAARRSDDPDSLLALGAAHFYIGQNALQQRGDAAAALESFRAYLEAAERNAQVDPDGNRVVRELSYARNAVAGALLAQGRAEEALEQQERIVLLLRSLLDGHSGDQGVLLDLADNLSWLASAQEKAGRLEAAHESFEEELVLRRELVAADQRNAEARTRLSFCLTFLANLHLATGRVDDALESALEARDLLAELSALDPQNAELKDRLGVAEGVLAQARAAVGGG